MESRDSAPSRVTRTIATFAAYAAGVALVALMFATTINVVWRKLFNAPVEGIYDLTQIAVLLMVFLGLAYCGYHGGHVVIELLFDRLPARAKGPLVRAINALGGAIFTMVGWRLADQSVYVREIGEASQTMAWPYFPFYWVAAFGSALFALVMFLRVFEPEKPQRSDEAP